MRGLMTWLALPTSLLLSLASISQYALSAQDLNDPRHNGESFTNYGELVRREVEAEKKITRQAPIGVKKMKYEGEKFWLHYWDFGEVSASEADNSSMPLRLLPGVIPHYERRDIGMGLLGRSLFGRDFKCPDDTHSCSDSIDANICCRPDQNCVSTNEGPGCCPDGETCGDSVGECTDGYTTCNDGCCIPGAECRAGGCVLYDAQTVTTTLSTVTKTSGDTSTTITGSGKTVTVFVPTISVSTKTVTLSSNGKTTKTLISPATTKASPNPPVLPTSVSSSIGTDSSCLQGYYMCSAHYLGGCCKVGRDCDTTHCPPTGTTITAKSGVTIVESAPTNVHLTCTGGLYSCPASASGGCCPNGYRCAIESCIAGKNAIGDTAKVAPSSASIHHWPRALVVLAVSVGVVMIFL